ncbi:hypothetical protein FALBO_8392 [Fusarium albosuccineum]|uniref:Uncharacterized protein n=1 Tax=Fusarium albosuccineum TaxID=1237068 RepID=A0A8H4LAW5_9HYPO|nr:hypothetical protein FALBO_8392 [Fusarium albosuccineum]
MRTEDLWIWLPLREGCQWDSIFNIDECFDEEYNNFIFAMVGALFWFFQNMPTLVRWFLVLRYFRRLVNFSKAVVSLQIVTGLLLLLTPIIWHEEYGRMRHKTEPFFNDLWDLWYLLVAPNASVLFFRLPGIITKASILACDYVYNGIDFQILFPEPSQNLDADPSDTGAEAFMKRLLAEDTERREEQERERRARESRERQRDERPRPAEDETRPEEPEPSTRPNNEFSDSALFQFFRRRGGKPRHPLRSRRVQASSDNPRLSDGPELVRVSIQRREPGSTDGKKISGYVERGTQTDPITRPTYVSKQVQTTAVKVSPTNKEPEVPEAKPMAKAKLSTPTPADKAPSTPKPRQSPKVNGAPETTATPPIDAASSSPAPAESVKAESEPQRTHSRRSPIKPPASPNNIFTAATAAAAENEPILQDAPAVPDASPRLPSSIRPQARRSRPPSRNERTNMRQNRLRWQQGGRRITPTSLRYSTSFEDNNDDSTKIQDSAKPLEFNQEGEDTQACEPEVADSHRQEHEKRNLEGVEAPTVPGQTATQLTAPFPDPASFAEFADFLEYQPGDPFPPSVVDATLDALCEEGASHLPTAIHTQDTPFRQFDSDMDVDSVESPERAATSGQAHSSEQLPTAMDVDLIDFGGAPSSHARQKSLSEESMEWQPEQAVTASEAPDLSMEDGQTQQIPSSRDTGYSDYLAGAIAEIQETQDQRDDEMHKQVQQVLAQQDDTDDEICQKEPEVPIPRAPVHQGVFSQAPLPQVPAPRVPEESFNHGQDEKQPESLADAEPETQIQSQTLNPLNFQYPRPPVPTAEPLGTPFFPYPTSRPSPASETVQNPPSSGPSLLGLASRNPGMSHEEDEREEIERDMIAAFESSDDAHVVAHDPQQTQPQPTPPNPSLSASTGNNQPPLIDPSLYSTTQPNHPTQTPSFTPMPATTPQAGSFTPHFSVGQDAQALDTPKTATQEQIAKRPGILKPKTRKTKAQSNPLPKLQQQQLTQTAQESQNTEQQPASAPTEGGQESQVQWDPESPNILALAQAVNIPFNTPQGTTSVSQQLQEPPNTFQRNPSDGHSSSPSQEAEENVARHHVPQRHESAPHIGHVPAIQMGGLMLPGGNTVTTSPSGSTQTTQQGQATGKPAFDRERASIRALRGKPPLPQQIQTSDVRSQLLNQVTASPTELMPEPPRRDSAPAVSSDEWKQKELEKLKRRAEARKGKKPQLFHQKKKASSSSEASPARSQGGLSSAGPSTPRKLDTEGESTEEVAERLLASSNSTKKGIKILTPGSIPEHLRKQERSNSED